MSWCCQLRASRRPLDLSYLAQLRQENKRQDGNQHAFLPCHSIKHDEKFSEYTKLGCPGSDNGSVCHPARLQSSGPSLLLLHLPIGVGPVRHWRSLQRTINYSTTNNLPPESLTPLKSFRDTRLLRYTMRFVNRLEDAFGCTEDAQNQIQHFLCPMRSQHAA